MFNYLRDVLFYPKRASLDLDAVPEDFKELGEGLVFFAEMLKEMRELASDLSRGELRKPLPSNENELASNLKSLHATLKHLTWQTQQVAQGDYNQHVSFMGDFSVAFNSMVEQLKERRDDMLEELEVVKEKTQDLARSNSLFETITGLMPEWIVMIDRETGEHLFANHEVRHNLASPLFEKQLYQILVEFTQDMAEDEEVREEEFPLLSDEAFQWFHLFLYPVRWYEHNAVAAVLTDITAEKEQREELENVAYKDMLTGTYNRHYGMKLLNDWIASKQQFIISFVDMDRLKYVNDVYGHQEGDKYILKVSELLAKFSPTAQVCRLGGDEFMLLNKDYTLEEGEAHMEELRSELVADEYISDDGKITYQRSLSYGVVEASPDNDIPASELLSTADEKMYEYKKAHKAERRDAPG